MPYAATWTNGNTSGRVVPAEHFCRDEDAAELAAAVNRRRRLVYLAEHDFSSQIGSLKPIRAATLAGQVPPPFLNLRSAVTGPILAPATGGLGGEPATPAGMDWLWPLAGGDENKPIVPCDPQPGQVGLMEELNGTADWTDPGLTAGDRIRAVHVNELRQAIEWIVRGRWRLPLYLPAGIFSVLPNTPWVGDSIANNGANEVRSVGCVLARTADAPPLGLTDVTVRAATHLTLTTDCTCQVEVYRCLRPIQFLSDNPTWNQYDPSAGLNWTAPGGAGAGDATLLGSALVPANVPTAFSSAALTEAVQAMLDGAEQNFMLRRGDSGYQTVGVAAELVVEFDLSAPPN